MSDKAYPREYFAKSYTARIPTIEELDKNLAPFKSSLVSFVKALPPNAKLLDAGCGVGKAVTIVRAYRPDVDITAIDISAVAQFLPQEVQFHQLPVEEIGNFFGADVFDAIISQHVIEHLLYPIGMMENIKKVLKPGGKLYIETPNWTRLLVPSSPIFFWNDYTHVRIFTRQAMERLLSDFDFAVDEIRTVSSAGFMVRGDSVKKVSALYVKGARGNFFAALLGKLSVRIMSPFLHDILIAIATKK